MVYYYNLNKSWEELDTEQLPLRKIIFLQKIVELYSSSNAYAVSILVNASIFGTTSIYGNRNDSYLLLPFSCNLKIISLISPHLISLFFKMYSRKIDIPNILNFQKTKKELGDLFGSKNPTRGKYTWNRAFNY